jgi:hypothetical protein
MIEIRVGESTRVELVEEEDAAETGAAGRDDGVRTLESFGDECVGKMTGVEG